MSVYSLPQNSEAYIRAALVKGGPAGLTLIKPMHELRAWLHVELAGKTLEVVVDISNSTNCITLQTDDSANAQHVADFIEAIANGTAGTAEEAPIRPHHSLTNLLQALEVPPADFLRPDMVDHPPHYTGHPSGVECIEVAEHLPFCLGNAFKYLFRRGNKGNAAQDVEKAIWYVNRQNETLVDKPALPTEAREALGLVVTHEPHPIGAAMLLIAGEEQCGGYDACIEMLKAEATRLHLIAGHDEIAF